MGFWGQKKEVKIESFDISEIQKIHFLVKENYSRVYRNIVELCDSCSSIKNELEYARKTKKSLIDSRRMKSDEIDELEYKSFREFSYLYLSKDFFSALSYYVSGQTLNRKQMALIVKFAPYIVNQQPVLSIRDEEDESLMEMFADVGRMYKEVFVGTKDDKKPFKLQEYVGSLYADKIEEMKLIEVDVIVELYQSTVAKVEGVDLHRESITVLKPSLTTNDDILCSCCCKTIAKGVMFCPYCGAKNSRPKQQYCTGCGAPIVGDIQFCGICGTKVL